MIINVSLGIEKAHPICGNCTKAGSECVYDNAPSKKSSDLDATDEDGHHGIKRRRQTLQSVDEDEDNVTTVVHERQPPPSSSSSSRNGSLAIQAQLNKLTSMIENLSKAKGPLPVEEMNRQLRTISQRVDMQSSSEGKLAAACATTSSSNKMSVSGDHSPRRNGEPSGDEFPVPSGNATDPVDPVGLNLGHLSLEDGRSRLVKQFLRNV